MKVNVSDYRGPLATLNFDTNMKAEDILKLVEDRMEYPIYACKVDNVYRGLLHDVHHDCELQFLDMRNNATWLVYQSSLVLLFIKAVHDCMGREVLVKVHNSLNKGLFITLSRKISESDVRKLNEHMRELVEADLPIIKQHMSREEAIALTERNHDVEAGLLLKSADDLDDLEIYSLDDETEIFYNFLVPSTGYLQYFELRLYHKGILLRYPHSSDPLRIPDYVDQKLLYKAFGESNHWGELMGITYVDDLNRMIQENRMANVYLMQEALHEKRIADIADDIYESEKRLVLICGPSSSGKTTFAKRLCIQLGVLGVKTLYMGTDDYFVERDESPVDENGEADYESIKAVDTKLFVSNLQDLLDGKVVDLPVFDFIEGTKKYGQRFTQIEDDVVLVIEGIHALNRILTDGIDDDEKFKIYISPFTPIGIDQHNRIPTTDCRLLRRLVRDYQFRGWSVHRTLDGWPKVRAGEEKNIFPFNGEADVFFNSNCLYELAVLKKYAEPLLRQVTREEPEYAEAVRLLDFLRYVDEVTDDHDIANNSIIREFIGGSVIVH